MEIIELYTIIDGDYEGLVKRLGSDKLVNTLLGLFLKDVNFENLTGAMTSENYEEAFKAAHGLKGLCANLSIMQLLGLASDITEALRNGADIEEAKRVYPKLCEEYDRVTNEISSFVQ